MTDIGDDPRLQQVIDMITRLAAGDFDTEPVRPDRDDDLGAILTGLEMLGEELRESFVTRDYFDNIINSMGHAVVVLDDCDRLKSLNATARDLLSYGGPVDPGPHAREFIPESSLTDLAEQTVSHPGRAARCDTWIHGGDDDPIPVSILRSALKDAVGRSLGTLLVIEDARDRRAMEAQLMQADRLASLGTLAAGVAHEVNNPLSYIIANLEFIAEEIEAHDGKDEVVDAVRDARDGAVRLKNIVRGLKTFSRSEQDAQRAFDVVEVVERTMRLAQNEVRHTAKLTSTFETAPLALGDPGGLAQVVLNLLLNAAQALSSSPNSQAEIRVAVKSTDTGEVLIEVEDNGPGIAEDVRPHIFDPFFTTKPIGEGTGLGLSICRNIVTRVGGTIDFESKVGVGTVFRVTLRPTDEAVPASAPQPEERPTGSLRLLIIDDEAPLLGALRRALTDFEVACATSIPEALKLWEGKEFDVVLCDLMLPGQDGIDLYDKISADRPGQEDRLVFMTGGPFTDRAREFVNHHRRLVMDKPIAVNDLRKMLRRRAGR